MSNEKHSSQIIEYEFVFTPKDDEFAYSSRNVRAKAVASLKLLVSLIVFAIQLYGVYGLIEFLPGAIIPFLSLFLSCFINLLFIILVLHSFWNNEYQIEPFSPIKIKTWVSDDGIYNKTPYAYQYFDWRLVTMIRATKYGLGFQTRSSRWFVPISAFPSQLALYADEKRIRQIWEKHK